MATTTDIVIGTAMKRLIGTSHTLIRGPVPVIMSAKLPIKSVYRRAVDSQKQSTAVQ